jgi:cysteinyl-tRNA synthetase
MLGVLGVDPLASTWAEPSSEDAYREALDVLVRGLLEHRQEARIAKDFTTADRVRDQLVAAGVDIEDTAQGPRWSVGGKN